jgi:hypothetical protein
LKEGRKPLRCGSSVSPSVLKTLPAADVVDSTADRGPQWRT